MDGCIIDEVHSTWCCPCPAGQESPSQGSLAPCEICSAGKWDHDFIDGTVLGGWSRSSDCKDLQGQWSSCTPCRTCEPGSYTPGNVTECATCDAGSWDDDGLASTVCAVCSSGKFTPGSGVACELCNAGRVDHDSSATTPCQDCSPGMYAKDGTHGGCSTGCPPAYRLPQPAGSDAILSLKIQTSSASCSCVPYGPFSRIDCVHRPVARCC